jgi:hypothetical protein
MPNDDRKSRWMRSLDANRVGMTIRNNCFKVTKAWISAIYMCVVHDGSTYRRGVGMLAPVSKYASLNLQERKTKYAKASCYCSATLLGGSPSSGLGGANGLCRKV